MNIKLQIRRGTATEWSTTNPVLAAGEPGYDITNEILKIGDGTSQWLDLPDVDNQSATQIIYNPSESQLIATDVQDAIDEIDGRVVSAEQDISTINGQLDIIEGNDTTAGSIAKALKDAKDYTDGVAAAQDADDEITYDQSGQTYALGTNVRQAIYAIDDELIAQDGRLDVIEGSGTGSIAKALADANDYTDAEILNAQLNLGNNYSVATITERDNLTNLAVGDVIFVADDGDSKWAQYKVTVLDPLAFLKVMDQDIFLNALSAPDVKAAYESNADTNAFTDALLTKLNTTDIFDEAGTYAGLRAQSTTQADVGLSNVTNESKATMFTDPTFTGTTSVTGTLDVQSAGSVLGFTKSMVGLGSVENYGIATKSNAETGTDNTLYMTPLRTAEAVAFQVTLPKLGLENVTNESKATMFTDPTFTGTVTGVTKSHVGLGNVENYLISNKSDAEAGSNNELYMTPLRTAEAVAFQVTLPKLNLENVTNESKATMFNNPTFTNTVTIAGDNPKLTGLPLPVDATDAASKVYVDNLAQGLKARTAAQVLADFDLDATYNSVPALHELTANNNEAFPEIDDISSTLLNVEGMRVLVTGQTNLEENGLYVLKTAGVDGVSPWVLRRCTQCDTSEKIPGSFIFIVEGTVYQNTGWVLDVANSLTFVLGTDAIEAIQFAGAGVFTNGTGLDLDVNVFSLADNYGDTKNPYASKNANQVLASPDAGSGAPVFRALVAGDIPSLSANKITSDILNVDRIPDLDASKLITGTLDVARIPNLSANKITTDTLNVDRIPTLAQSKITNLETDLSARVVGPASAVDTNFAAFDGTTGKLIGDSGFAASSFAKISIGSTAPVGPSAGDLWFNNDAQVKNLFFYDGTDWIGVNTYQ